MKRGSAMNLLPMHSHSFRHQLNDPRMRHLLSATGLRMRCLLSATGLRMCRLLSAKGWSRQQEMGAGAAEELLGGRARAYEEGAAQGDGKCADVILCEQRRLSLLLAVCVLCVHVASPTAPFRAIPICRKRTMRAGCICWDEACDA
jgi:hypothetical protein